MITRPFSFLLIVICFLIFTSCSDVQTQNHHKREYRLIPDTGIRYAKRFAISENEKFKIVYLFGNVDIRDTTATYIIVKDSSLSFDTKARTYVIKPPCKKIASLSSVYTSMLVYLNELDNIAAIENSDYYTNPLVIQKFKEGKLKELVKSPELDVEKTVALNPDIIFTFGMGNPDKELNRKLLLAGIPMVIAVDHLEETPLARAEWIKFFAAFVDKKNMADSLFAEVEKNYQALKELASSAKTKPSVLTEIKYGEIWYVPGGKSSAAKFIKDAHANYIWSENDKTGSLHLGFEEVYAKAKDADYWLNMAMVKSANELVSQEPRYSEFKPFKNRQLYNNIKNINEKGYSDYWETGIIFPDKVLSDLIYIFHPELRPSLKNDLYYYVKLE